MIHRGTRPPPARGTGERGQSMVELAMILPVFLILLTALLEFGLAFNHHLTLEYATREGARAGASLVNGGGQKGCGSGQSPNAADVDPAIISAVQRVLTSPGSPVKVAEISEIRIYRSLANGSFSSQFNAWAYSAGGGITYDGVQLKFVQQSNGWPACSREYDQPIDSLGVSLHYTYRLETPLPALLGLVGGGQGPTLAIDDRTVMALNPPPRTATPADRGASL